MPVPTLASIEYVTDETGNAIARPALIYASNENEGTQFRVMAPDGTCVIGGSSGLSSKGVHCRQTWRP